MYIFDTFNSISYFGANWISFFFASDFYPAETVCIGSVGHNIRFKEGTKTEQI